MSDPVLVIGKEGVAEYEFGNIVGLGLMDSGEWVLYDRGSRQLRFYNSAGEFQRNAGRAGEGPGEFRDVYYMGVVDGNRIVTYDQQLRRLTEWDGRGEVTQTRRVAAQPTGTVLRPIGFAGSNALVWMNFITPECRLNETLTDSVIYYVTPLRSRGDIASSDITPLLSTRGGLSWGSARNVLGRCIPQRIPLAGGPLSATSSAALFVAARRGVTLTRYDLVTSQESETNLPLPANPTTDDVIEAQISGVLGAATRDELGRPLPTNAGMDLLEKRLRELPWPDSLPAVDQLVVDGHGLVWLRSPAKASDSGAHWTVFSPRGELVTQLTLPGRMRVLEIGVDYIAGVDTDPVGIQRVVVRKLNRGSNEHDEASGA